TGGFASTGPLAIPGSVSARPGTGSGAPLGSPPVGANDSATSTRRDTGASGENAEATRSCTSDPAPATSADTAAFRGRRFASVWRGPYPTRFATRPSDSSPAPAVVAGAAAPEPSSIPMIGVPTSTVSPSAASNWLTVPSNGIGNSTRDLEVSTSTTMSLVLTVSPSATCQVTISASTSPSPGSGSRNSFMDHISDRSVRPGSIRPGSIRQGPVDGVEHPVQVGQVVVLHAGGRIGGVEATDAQHRRLQRVEAL